MLIILSKTLQLLIALSLLVFVHELGHFFFARLFKVRVERFFLFFDMGRPLLQYKSKRSGTIYGLGWLPLGGYCSLAGMLDERSLLGKDPSPVKQDEFRAKSAWQRLLIMFGGILFNLIFAIIIYTGITYTWGEKSLWSDQISSGMSFSPLAHSIGLKDNDIILRVDGQRKNALSPAFFRSILEAKEITIDRKGEKRQITIPPDLTQQMIKDNVGFMGIQIPFVVKSVTENTAAAQAQLLKGDQIIQIDSVPIVDVIDAILYLKSEPKSSHIFQIKRNNQIISKNIRTDSIGRIGVVLEPMDQIYPIDHISYSLIQSIPKGLANAYQTLANYVGDMKYVFTKEGASQMGGFISIGKIFPSLFDPYTFWSLTALLSLILAFMNFLPIPMLDGGYILFTIWEIISGKKISDKALLKANKWGFFLLLALLIYANGNDLLKALFS